MFKQCIEKWIDENGNHCQCNKPVIESHCEFCVDHFAEFEMRILAAKAQKAANDNLTYRTSIKPLDMRRHGTPGVLLRMVSLSEVFPNQSVAEF